MTNNVLFTGYLDGEKVLFSLDDIWHLILTHSDGTEEQYNEEYYDGDSYVTIRDMLIRENVTDLRYIGE